MNPRYYRAVDPSSDLVAVERAAGTGRRVRASESKRSESRTRPPSLRPKQLAIGAVVAVVVLAVVAIASASVLRNDDQSSSSPPGPGSEDGGTPTATDEPGGSSEDANPGSNSLIGTWKLGEVVYRFEQDGDQVTGTEIEDGSGGDCAGAFVGEVRLVLVQTAPSTYEGQSTGASNLDTCEIDSSPDWILEVTMVVDGDTAEFSTSASGDATALWTRVS